LSSAAIAQWWGMDTLTRVEQVFRSLFDDDALTLTRETTAQDIEAWDSVAHVNLMLEVESLLGIRFSISEIAYLKNVGDLVDLIDRKLGAHE
jgi:acyl carrier protein